jgi:integrase
MQVVKSINQVDAFLNSIGRNSHNTKRSYHTALLHFEQFLKDRQLTPNTIIPSIQKGKLNAYEILDEFVSYLFTQDNVSKPTLKIYIAAIRSYFQYHDIDISISRFKRKVKMPKVYADPEEPLTITDIRELFEYNHNHRLRTYLLLLASTGMRAMEACSLRLIDVDFSIKPTRITIRKETTKTKRGRIIYCSNEATKHMHKLLELHEEEMQPEDLVFSVNGSKSPITIYNRILEQFEKLQQIANKDQKKENSRRRKITFHSFRRTVFSIMNQNIDTQYADWFLGHNHSVYWTHTEKERRDIYVKCMPYLTIIDFAELDRRQKDIQSELQELQAFKAEMKALLSNPKQFMKMLQENK